MRATPTGLKALPQHEAIMRHICSTSLMRRGGMALVAFTTDIIIVMVINAREAWPH